MTEQTLSLQFHDATWFAEKIDMSEDWVRRNVKHLPHHKVGRLTKFDDHCVALYGTRTAVTPTNDLVRSPGSQARKNR